MSSLSVPGAQVAAPSVAREPAGKNRFNELSSEEFMKIIFTELTNQDPLKPNDSSALLEQLNSIRSIESDAELTKQLSSIVTQNQLATAGGLIGREIQGLTEDANRVVGKVISVAREKNDVKLLLDSGWVVPMDSLEAIVDPSAF
jgi:flagellar basal-body rod modification protein FlgD